MTQGLWRIKQVFPAGYIKLEMVRCMWHHRPAVAYVTVLADFNAGNGA